MTMHYPKNDFIAMQSIRLTQHIIDFLESYKKEISTHPSCSGEVTSLHYARNSFEQLQTLLDKQPETKEEFQKLCHQGQC